MGKSPSLNQKLVSIGVSKPYASQIANEKRAPSLGLALKIYRELGLKIGPVSRLTGAQIAALSKMGVKNVPKVPA